MILVFIQAVVMVLESKGDKAIQMMVKLLKAFWKIGLITVDQMNRVSPISISVSRYELFASLYHQYRECTLFCIQDVMVYMLLVLCRNYVLR